LAPGVGTIMPDFQFGDQNGTLRSGPSLALGRKPIRGLADRAAIAAPHAWDSRPGTQGRRGGEAERMQLKQ
jgi:hypothetical protein